MWNNIFETIKKYRIIDSHGHIGYYKSFNIPDSNPKKMVSRMDSLGIEKICISSMAGLELDCIYGNNMVAEAIQRFRDRLLGYANINPFEHAEIIPELERCFDKLNMTAIKLHPDLSECPADSKLFIPVYEFAHNRKLIIMSHSWGTSRNLTRIASKYYNIKFIQAHDGSAWDGSQEIDRMKAVKELDNAWLDTAGSSSYFGAFEKTVEYMGEDKLLFGTDFPFLDACQQIGNVVFSDVSEDAKVKILRTNFLRLIER